MQRNFNPQGPRGPRLLITLPPSYCLRFQSTRPSRASTDTQIQPATPSPISIHKALAGLDLYLNRKVGDSNDFNPQGPRGPRQYNVAGPKTASYFNPQGPRGPRHVSSPDYQIFYSFQSTRPSRASTLCGDYSQYTPTDFNPQGPRGPRQVFWIQCDTCNQFQSTRPSRASTIR